jgi:holliday junction DNA helicase RuvA
VIGSLRGTVLDRPATGDLLVEVGGVGYRVTVTTGTLSATGEVGAPVFLHVHTHVRDDAIVLFGFATRDERACFEALISAHGVGPSLGVAILSAISPPVLRRAVACDDVDVLTMVPGVGKKTAARLLLELKSKLDVDGDESTLAAVGAAAGNGTRAEVRAALAGLGYGPEEVRDAVRDLPDDGPVEDHLRLALRTLATAR